MPITLYTVKPRFQALLRPLVRRLASAGVTANQVTLAAAAVSLLLGGLIAWASEHPHVFLLLPLWLALRMALNAIDGMLAREFNQKSTLGAWLNELGDVISDTALYAPLALIPPLGFWATGLVIVLALLTEFAGVMGPGLGASRRYDGPLGKSDRALVFGALGLWIGSGFALPHWMAGLMPVLAILLAWTTFNRVRAGLREAAT